MKKLLFAIFVVTTIISFTSCRNKKEQDKAKQQVEKVKENVNDAVDKVSDKIEDGADAVDGSLFGQFFEHDGGL